MASLICASFQQICRLRRFHVFPLQIRVRSFMAPRKYCFTCYSVTKGTKLLLADKWLNHQSTKNLRLQIDCCHAVPISGKIIWFRSVGFGKQFAYLYKFLTLSHFVFFFLFLGKILYDNIAPIFDLW